MFKKFLISVLMFGLVSSQTYATSGRTNADGCHNSKTEGYHCHGKKNKQDEKGESVHAQ